MLARDVRPEDRIPELDGLRGVLAWFVVLVHVTICCGWFGPNWNGRSVLSEVAQSALNLYILLSGYAITRLLVVKREPYWEYVWRRACRIVPAYWVALSAAIALNGWLAANLRRLPPTPDTELLVMICELGASRIWIDSALHYTLLHGLAPVPLLPWAPFTFLGVAWSLSLEWQFYVIAPLALLFASRSRYALAFLVAMGGIGLGLADYWSNWSSVAFIGIKGGFILAGALTFVVAARDAPTRLRWWLLLMPCYIASFLWWAGSSCLIEAGVTAAGWTAVMVSVYFVRFHAVSRFLTARLVQYLGRVSYSTYLFHVPVITVLQRAIWTWISPTTQWQLFAWTLTTAVVGTLAVSALGWRFIEQPFLKLGRPAKVRA